MPKYRIILSGARIEPITVEANNVVSACTRACATRIRSRINDGADQSGILNGYVDGTWADVVSIEKEITAPRWETIPLI